MKDLFPGLPEKLILRVEQITYADIEVDAAGLIEEWKDDDTTPWDREDVIEVLYKIGIADLLYDGEFIKVLDKDTEESIQ